MHTHRHLHSLRCRFESIDRLVQGLSALFLALRRRPVVRYQRSSSTAQKLAEGLYALTYKQQVCVSLWMCGWVCKMLDGFRVSLSWSCAAANHAGHAYTHSRAGACRCVCHLPTGWRV